MIERIGIGLVGMVTGALLFVYGLGWGGDSTPSGVPSTGEAGVSVEEFCNDKTTSVVAVEVPDGEGVTYQLVRVKDKKTDMIVLPSGPNYDNPNGRYFWYPGERDANGDLVQEVKPAFATMSAYDCLAKKVAIP